MAAWATGRGPGRAKGKSLPFWAQLPSRFWFAVFLTASLGKTYLWALVVLGGVPLLGWIVGPESGNDGDYYHAYAQGRVGYATSLWPVLLRGLYEAGMYSRQGVAFLNMLLGVWLVPIAAAYVAVGGFKVRGAGHRLFWFSAAVVALYPAPFWFTLDIYRDVFMLSIFLIGVYVARRYFSKATLARVGYAALFAVLVGVLFHLRGYLGFSLGLGFLLAHLFSRFRLRWEAIFAGLVLYGMALYVAHTVGLLAPVAQYRGEEGFAGGGSSFGLGFQGRSGMDFLRVFGLSFVYQVLGLYLNSFKAFLLFLAESLPFLYFAAGVWGARLRLDFFSKFLLLFALAYTTVFVLGNDNLGTAMRLRIFVYLAVFMVWARAQAQRSAVGWASFPSTTGREALGT